MHCPPPPLPPGDPMKKLQSCITLHFDPKLMPAPCPAKIILNTWIFTAKLFDASSSLGTRYEASLREFGVLFLTPGLEEETHSCHYDLAVVVVIRKAGQLEWQGEY